MTPLARTMARLNASGWTGEIVERRLCSKAMHDPFGLDVIAVKGLRTLGIQVTDVDHYAAHRKDIEANPLCRLWVSAGNELEVWAWHVRGKKKPDPLIWPFLMETWPDA